MPCWFQGGYLFQKKILSIAPWDDLPPDQKGAPTSPARLGHPDPNDFRMENQGLSDLKIDNQRPKDQW